MNGIEMSQNESNSVKLYLKVILRSNSMVAMGTFISVTATRASPTANLEDLRTLTAEGFWRCTVQAWVRVEEGGGAKRYYIHRNSQKHCIVVIRAKHQLRTPLHFTTALSHLRIHVDDMPCRV